jgi:hypothetical protein
MSVLKKSCKLPGVLGASLFFSLATALSLPAEAASTYYKFYAGGSGYTGPYSGPGTVYDATKGLATLCPGACTGSDIFGASLDFGTVTATATAGLPGGAGQRVWDDFAPNFGGLGVDTLGVGDASEDQISGTEVLKLTFDDQVRLTGLATLFVAAHQGFGTGFGTPALVSASKETIKLKISVDGGSWMDFLFNNANNNLLSLVGKEFSFMQADGSPTYYVGAVAVSAVPLPAALPLMASGLALLGFFGLRRKSTAA